MKARANVAAFTVIELLAVIAITGLLAALILPALARGREAGHSAKCISNLRQLVAGNQLYASDAGSYIPAAADIFGPNLKRWHGTRSSKSQPFISEQGPLAPYLEGTNAIRVCPSFKPSVTGFEAGCGGYGYNDKGVGSRAYLYGALPGAGLGMTPGAIRNPGSTVMFTDAAFLQWQKGKAAVIEYSFAEAYYQLAENEPEPAYPAVPSIHFRHAQRAGVAWCDGHVTMETLTTEYAEAYTQTGFGWFGGADNSLFDPF